MPESLTFVIQPVAESLSLATFLKAIEDVRRLVRDVDYAVTREKRGRRWVVTQLRSSAPTITIRPIIDGTEAMDTLVTGLRTMVMEQPLAPPPHFSEDALEDLKRMSRLFRGAEKARSIEFSTDGAPVATVREDIGKKVEVILRGGYSSLGSIEGMLEAINLHGTPTFTIWDRVSGLPVRCAFPKDASWVERVKSLLERRVLVSGQVNYFHNGTPRSITHIHGLQDYDVDVTLPKATFGSVPNITGGKDTMDYLRSIRG